jgi:uncharacterized membrane protein
MEQIPQQPQPNLQRLFVGKLQRTLMRRVGLFGRMMQHHWRWPRLRQVVQLQRRIVLSVALFWMIVSQPLLSSSAAGAAVTGGRIGGGSFSSSPAPAPRMRSAPSRSFGGRTTTLPRSYNHHYHHYQHRPSPNWIVPIFVPSRCNNYCRPVVVGDNDDSRIYVVQKNNHPVRDIVIAAGTVAAVAYVNGVMTKSAKEEVDRVENSLQVGSLTVTFSVPNNNNNRGHQNSLLDQIKRIAATADTTVPGGVSELVADVCIELLWNIDSIDSACWDTNEPAAAAPGTSQQAAAAAEQTYRRQSALMQSKFDRFVVNKFGAQDKSASPAAAATPLPSLHNGSSSSAADEESRRPTLGLVTILYAATENKRNNNTKRKPQQMTTTKQQPLRTRDDLRTALSELASLGNNVKVAEVIWAPAEVD